MSNIDAFGKAYAEVPTYDNEGKPATAYFTPIRYDGAESTGQIAEKLTKDGISATNSTAFLLPDALACNIRSFIWGGNATVVSPKSLVPKNKRFTPDHDTPIPAALFPRNVEDIIYGNEQIARKVPTKTGIVDTGVHIVENSRLFVSVPVEGERFRVATIVPFNTMIPSEEAVDLIGMSPLQLSGYLKATVMAAHIGLYLQKSGLRLVNFLAPNFGNINKVNRR